MVEALPLFAMALVATWVTFGFLITDHEDESVRRSLLQSKWMAVVITALTWIGAVGFLIRKLLTGV